MSQLAAWLFFCVPAYLTMVQGLVSALDQKLLGRVLKPLAMVGVRGRSREKIEGSGDSIFQFIC